MDCGCDSGYGGGYGSGYGYNGYCNADTPYPSVSSESVPSLINNLVTSLYGQVQKNVTNGQVRWTIPCDPTNPNNQITNLPPIAGEGFLCYIIRGFNSFADTQYPVTLTGTQTLSNKTLLSAILSGGTSLSGGSSLIGGATISGGASLSGGLSLDTLSGTNATLSGNTQTQNLNVIGSLTLPSGSVTSSMIANGTIVDADISSSAAINPSKLAGVTATGSTTSRTLANRFSDAVNVKDFGATGDGTTDDTTAIASAISYANTNKIYCVLFPSGNYSVTTLTINSYNTVFLFEGAVLVGKASSSTACIIKYTGAYCNFYNLTINGNFNSNYTSAIWWYNDSASSQFNNFYNLDIKYTIRGIIYGASIGSNSTNYAQSENYIFGAKFTGVQNLIYNNHTNGRLVFSASTLNVGPEGWATSSNPSGFNMTNARVFEQHAGVLTFADSEFVISQSYNGNISTYSYEIYDSIPSDLANTSFRSEVYINNCLIESYSGALLNSGKLNINFGRTEILSNSNPAFTVLSSSSPLFSLFVANHNIFRQAQTGSYSGVPVINNSATDNNIEVVFNNCVFSEWNPSPQIVSGSSRYITYDNCKWLTSEYLANLTIAGTTATLNAVSGTYTLPSVGNTIIVKSSTNQNNAALGLFTVTGTTSTTVTYSVPNGTSVPTGEIVFSFVGSTFLLNTAIPSLIPNQVDISGGTTNGWYFYNQYGSGSALTLNSSIPPNTTYRNSLQVLATGVSGCTTADLTSLSTVKATAISVKAGDNYLIEGWIKISAGTQGGLIVLGIDSAGNYNQWIYAEDQNTGITSNWRYLRGAITIPSGVYYIGIGFNASFSTVNCCGIRAEKADWPF